MQRFFRASVLAVTVLACVVLTWPTPSQAVQDEKKQDDKKQDDKKKVHEIGGDGLTINSKLANTDDRDPTAKDCYCKVYQVKMSAGKTYVIRMNAKDQKAIDAFLRVEDSGGKELASNDDAPGENTLNSRIDFKCDKDGVYKVYCTSLNPNEVGDFTMIIKLAK